MAETFQKKKGLPLTLPALLSVFAAPVLVNLFLVTLSQVPIGITQFEASSRGSCPRF